MHPKLPNRTNVARRTLLKTSVASAVSFSLGGTAQAQVAGNNNKLSWAATSNALVWQTAWSLRYTNALTNLAGTQGAPSAFYAPDAGTLDRFTITAEPATAQVLGALTTTPVWGYRNFEAAASFPGRSFKVQRNTPVHVMWKNGLVKGTAPVAHLLPVDQTINVASPNTGVPLAVHHHGGDTAAEFDGGPDQWATPLRKQIGPGLSGNALTPVAGAVTYQYSNQQEASMHWYHDHTEGLTRQNVYAGLAGLYFITDANEAALQAANVIPGPAHEIALLIQDRVFQQNGQLAYGADPAAYPVPGLALPANQPTHMPEMFGDVIVINGKAWPSTVIEPRPYRLRLLNGSDSRFYTLKFNNVGWFNSVNATTTWGQSQPSVYQIGTDLGFLNKGLALANGMITIAPGERLDLVVDFSACRGRNVIMSNSAATPFPAGVPPTRGTTELMRFQVTAPLNTAAAPINAQALAYSSLRRTADTPPLAPLSSIAATMVSATRRILIAEGADQFGRITAMLGNYDAVASKNHGTLTLADPATERPQLGSTEVWEFWNISVDSHPIHIHLAQFRVLDRTPFAAVVPQAKVMSNGWTGAKLNALPALVGPAVSARASEDGWKDTVVCPPNEVTRVQLTFNRTGKFVYHCHILSHEDHEMMRWFEVV